MEYFGVTSNTCVLSYFYECILCSPARFCKILSHSPTIPPSIQIDLFGSPCLIGVPFLEPSSFTALLDSLASSCGSEVCVEPSFAAGESSDGFDDCASWNRHQSFICCISTNLEGKPSPFRSPLRHTLLFDPVWSCPCRMRLPSLRLHHCQVQSCNALDGRLLLHLRGLASSSRSSYLSRK